MRLSTLLVTSVLLCVVGNTTLQAQQDDKPSKSLLDAVRDSDVEQVRRHVARGSKLDAPDEFGIYTPLKMAVEGQNVEIVQVLLDGGAKPDVKDRDGMTPLMFACGSGRKEIAEALLAKGANVNAKDNSDRTALHSAIGAAQTAMVELLVKAGADVNATTKQGQMPLSLARMYGQAEVVDLLTKHGAKEPVISDRYGDDYAYGGQAGATQAVAGPQREELPEIEIDPNVIRVQVKEFEGLEAALAAVDHKSDMEVRGWISRRVDNRTSLLRSVQKQFDDEIAFLKPIAVAEKAQETVKEIDDLAGRRKIRYERINEELRNQRREALLENRTSGAMTTGRGRSGRGGSTNTGVTTGRGRSARDTMQSTADPYGGAAAPARPARPLRQQEEPNEPPVDADTQTQIQAWLNENTDDRQGLLDAVHELDLYELGLVYHAAQKEEAKKTSMAVLAMMMLRGQRIVAIQQKWAEDDERMQRMQERLGTRGMGTTQDGTQPTTGRTRRR